MPERHELHVYLGALVRNAPPGANRSEFELLRALREVFGTPDIPVHWFLPPMLFEDAPPRSYADLLGLLEERLARGLDRTISVGFRGSFHPLLALRDVEKDLKWAVRNPWNTGTERALRQAPVGVFPFHPDLGRPGMLDVYKRTGYDTVLFLCRPSQVRACAWVWQEPESGLRFVPALHASADALRALRSLRRGPSEGGSLFLVVGAEEPRGPTVSETLAILAKRRGLRFHAWPEALGATRPVTLAELGDMSSGDIPCTPDARHQWLQVEPLRRSVRNADARALLGGVAYREKATGGSMLSEGVLDSRPRLHTSVMPGLVTLTGTAFDVRLDGGALCGLTGGGRELFPLARLRSYIAYRSGPRPYACESSASFEEEDGRGLRAMLALSGATLVTDYTFLDASPALLVDLCTSYPELPPDCRAVVPFGIAIPMGSDPVSIRRLTGDGGHQERSVGPDEKPHVPHTVAGTAFVVTAGDAHLCLSYPERRGLSYQTLQWLVLHEHRSRILLLNPLGTFYPAETPSYSNTREQITLVLSPQAEPPKLARAAIRACLAHRVVA